VVISLDRRLFCLRLRRCALEVVGLVSKAFACYIVNGVDALGVLALQSLCGDCLTLAIIVTEYRAVRGRSETSGGPE
jgi:hypothetical protein